MSISITWTTSSGSASSSTIGSTWACTGSGSSSAGASTSSGPPTSSRWGWIVGHEQWSSLDSNVRKGLARARETYQRPDSGFRNQEPAQSLKRTLEYLARRGAQVCVVTTPVSPEYYEYAKADSSTADAINYVRRVAELTGARYRNFFALFADPEFANYFRDMDHMNEIGAPRFTAMALSACFD